MPQGEICPCHSSRGARIQRSCAFKILKENFYQEFYTHLNWQFRVKTEETFSDMQNLKNDLLPMHLFTGGEGVGKEGKGAWGKLTIGKENCGMTVRRDQGRKLCNRSKDHILHEMRAGFQETSSGRSESLDSLMKMENNTSGLECSELVMNK